MTSNPETLGIDDGVAFALNRMIHGGFRHIPVVDDDGRAVGVLSQREIVAYIVSLLALAGLEPAAAAAARGALRGRRLGSGRISCEHLRLAVRNLGRALRSQSLGPGNRSERP